MKCKIFKVCFAFVELKRGSKRERKKKVGVREQKKKTGRKMEVYFLKIRGKNRKKRIK